MLTDLRRAVVAPALVALAALTVLFGEPRVNVLRLNLASDGLGGGGSGAGTARSP